ncbi:MAG: hypothetical protein RR623_05950, partial [Bacilli bacterium]
TDTPIPEWIEENDKVHLGGTGFYFDKAPNLPDKIEHHMPDYHLYDDWVNDCIEKRREEYKLLGKDFNESSYKVQFKEYLHYSIGFMTRGCFRKCGFCINQKYNHVFQHSDLNEFFDESRKKICLLDDNFLGCPKGMWKPMLQELIDTGKRFKFKQGLDERILDDEKCELLFSANYDGDYTFAFDNVSEYDLIQKKLKLIRKYTSKTNIKFYVLVGFESTDAQDIENAFKRIDLLLKYSCLPYVMRYQNKNDTPWKNSKYRGMYITLTRWANQPNLIKKMTFRDFCEANQALHKTEGTLCSAMKALVEFENEYPDIANRYYDVRFGENK